MLQRLTRCARSFSHRAGPERTCLMAVIGNNPKVPEYIRRHRLDKYMTPVYFQNEAEMMVPRDYDAALVVDSNLKQMEAFTTAQKNLRWVHSTMDGVDGILADKIKNSDIILTNAKGAFSHSLAEYVMFGLLYFSKHIPYFNEKKLKHEWAPIDVNFLSQATVGIIGYGDIGYRAAKMLKKSVNPTIYACCKNMSDITEKQMSVCDLVVDAHSYEDVLRVSDFVVGVLPKTQHTVGYFDARKFQMMKKSAVFMNIGRGVTMVEVLSVIRTIVERPCDCAQERDHCRSCPRRLPAGAPSRHQRALRHEERSHDLPLLGQLA